MDPIDRELTEGLSPGPLVEDGFNDRLRRRIEQKLREPERRRSNRPRLLVASGALALVVVLIVLSPWSNLSLLPGGSRDDRGAGQPAQEQNVPPVVSSAEEIPFTSAALIGLRTDLPAPDGVGTVSEYRTYFVAPQEGKPALLAEGDGILLPYGQEFWKIEAYGADARRPDAQLLVSRKAEEAQPAYETLSLASGSERLLYAGNRYVSVLQTDEAPSATEAAAAPPDVWVKELRQLTAESRLTEMRTQPEAPAHVTIESVVPGAEPVPDDQWLILRNPGEWTARTIAYDAGGRRTSAWVPLDVELPKAVVSHDKLSLSWEELAMLEPGVRDAYTSPAGDLAVIVTDGALRLVPYGLADREASTVTLPLAADASVVMVQWAVDASYVSQWQERVPALLDPIVSRRQAEG